MRIVTGVEGSGRILRILDADPGQQTALAELGFGPDLARRFPPGTRYFDRAVANLRQNLEEMVRQYTTAGTPPGWAWPLEDLLRRAGQARVPVAVTGVVFADPAVFKAFELPGQVSSGELPQER